MSNNIKSAEALMSQGFAVIPLKKNQKHNTDKDILKRDYTLKDILNPIDNAWDSDGNLGINLAKSKLIDLDLENKHAVHFGSTWLPPTLSLGSGAKGVTHYFYKNINDEADLKLDTSIAEYRCEGQTVVCGSTKDKKTGELVNRYWQRTIAPTPAPKDLEKIFRKISFASWLAAVKTFENANTDALKLDSCIKRYTDWNEDERFNFLSDFFSYVLPAGHRDLKQSKFQRIIKANDGLTKNAGYVSFAENCGVKPVEMQRKLAWIGNMPESEDYNKTPSKRDFIGEGIDLKALMSKEIPPLKYAVAPILPEGLVLIAGRPKAMKSWTMLDLCYCVENGLDFLNHKVVQGNALYLALEDSERRLKDRIYKLGHNKRMNVPTCDETAPYLGFGLEQELQKWIDKVEDPRLIVIDTLARIKPKTKKSSGTAYDLDNELLRNIQKLAISNGVCIVLISHLSKTQTDYSYDRITGSAGLQGMTDAFWLMDRGDTENAKASIQGRGRDINDFAYQVKWNDLTFKYEWVGDKAEIERNENRASILNAMKSLYLFNQKENFQVKPAQINKELGNKAQSRDAKNVSRTVLRMCEGGEIHSGSKYGTYKLPTTPTPDQEIDDTPF